MKTLCSQKLENGNTDFLLLQLQDTQVPLSGQKYSKTKKTPTSKLKTIMHNLNMTWHNKSSSNSKSRVLSSISSNIGNKKNCVATILLRPQNQEESREHAGCWLPTTLSALAPLRCWTFCSTAPLDIAAVGGLPFKTIASYQAGRSLLHAFSFKI